MLTIWALIDRIRQDSGPFQIWDTIAQHDEIQLEDYLKENSHNANLRLLDRIKHEFWPIQIWDTIAQHDEIKLEDYRKENKEESGLFEPIWTSMNQYEPILQCDEIQYCIAWWNYLRLYIIWNWIMSLYS